MDRKMFSKEFKLEAIRLVHESGKTMKEVAADLGISDTAIRNWIRQYDAKPGPTQRGPNKGKEPFTPDEHAELLRLRRELKRVTEERDVLKKALGIFSKELP